MMCPILLVLLALLAGHCHCSKIVEIVSTIVAQEHQMLPEGVEVCFIQIRKYSSRRSIIDDTLGSLMKELTSKYPVTISRHYPPVMMYGHRQASLVILDATGFGKQFPTQLATSRLRSHECYLKTSKFVTFVDEGMNQISAWSFFDDLGIVNYLITWIPHHQHTLFYTQNRFTGQEYWFNWGEQHNGSLVDHYFPNKLTDIRGYHFRLVGIYEFPYLIDMGNNRTGGVLLECLRYLIERQLNGTISATRDQRIAADATFALTDFRETYMHDVNLKERIGSCVVCPFRTERDILGHLLKPFSVGIWLLLAAVLILFRILGLLFPRLFPGNLLSLMMFSESVAYRLPFPTRILSFATTVFVFFLSEAYNAKIISLMSLPASYERPEKLDEFKRSNLKIAIPGVRTQLLRDELPGKVLDHLQAQEIYNERQQEMYSEYCTVMPWYLALLYSSSGQQDPANYQLYLLQEQVIKRFLALQLAINSPFYPTFAEFFERYFQHGIWMHRVEWIRNALSSVVNKKRDQFESVVFHFDDLWCIWALIVTGWSISSTVFLGEMISDWSRTSGKVRWVRLLARMRKRMGLRARP